MATVSTKLTLDTSGFNRGIKSAENGMAKFKAAAGPAVLGGVAAGFAAAAAAAAGLAVGIKGALDLAGALSDLSSRTGVAAGELRILQEAFARNGLSADKVGPSINKMQRAVVEAGDGTGPAAEAFKMLGISVDGLRGMDASSQFAAIGQAINSIPDPAGRAAAAMQIFGKSGGEMLTLFANSGAMAEAARSVGDQADILTRNANLFDQASDILGSVATKMQGFFVGVADTLVPALKSLPGVQVASPKGGMYAFFQLPSHADSLFTAKRLVSEAGLGLAPGSAFAPESSAWLRWCFASKDLARLTDGVQRLERWLTSQS